MRQWQNFGGGGEGHGIGSEYLVFEDREFYILANKVCETQNWSHQGGLENEEIFEGIITYIKTHNNKKKLDLDIEEWESLITVQLQMHCIYV